MELWSKPHLFERLVFMSPMFEICYNCVFKESTVENVILASALEQTTENNISNVDDTSIAPLILQEAEENVLENVNRVIDVASEVESVLSSAISEKEQTDENKSKSNSSPVLKRVKERGLLNGDDESFSSLNSSASDFEYYLQENESVTVSCFF